MEVPGRRNRILVYDYLGYSQENRFTIPSHHKQSKSFPEHLSKYKKHHYRINGHEFCFIVEECRNDCFHACTVSDVVKMLKHIPRTDYGDLKYIIFRQPKRKEQILSPVWGRFIYAYEFENHVAPAIIIEAINTTQKLRWSKRMKVEDQKEFFRLLEDGHEFIEDKRYFTANYDLEKSRNTQLYRTFLHELGHYTHYRVEVELISKNEVELKKLDNVFQSLSRNEKEKFANRYADALYDELKQKGIIPFRKIKDE